MPENQIEQEIADYIHNYSREQYTEILQDDDRFEVFMHLSPTRQGLFSWYDFQGNEELLEVGGHFGELTGLFCEKCKHVVTVERSRVRSQAICDRWKDHENLEIYTDEKELWGNRCNRCRFDYIILIGELVHHKGEERQYLERFKTLLKKSGKILFAVENRYGLKYFCGEPETYSGIPFEGINQYPGKKYGYTFDRQELKDILRNMGVDNYKFYYPLPDYRNPQMILSDQYLPANCIRERLIPYYQNKHTLVANEMNIYLDLLRNDVFPFFANSFLVEFSFASDQMLSLAQGAMLSTDREESHGYATVIYEDHVCKKPLWKNAKKTLYESYVHNRLLKERQIPVVPQMIAENGLVMPRESKQPCNLFLLQNMNKEIILKVFDKLYEDILLSSEQVESYQNAMKKEDDQRDWGVILEKAYIDMVPANAFYEDGKLFYYDQEFVKENYPARYIMFRAVKYHYIYLKQANEVISQEEMAMRFGLLEFWEDFEQEEQRFITENRNKKIYQNFYRWTGASRSIIVGNASLLLEHSHLSGEKGRT